MCCSVANDHAIRNDRANPRARNRDMICGASALIEHQSPVITLSPGCVNRIANDETCLGKVEA